MELNKRIFYGRLLVTLTLALTDVAEGHGGMTEPPMRSVAWKYGFDTPVNYDWMSLYCGGLNVFTQNNGTCGLCGDAYSGPFENDKGGIYDTGIIVRHYPAGLREIEVKVEITAHHKGYFQFKLCPNNAEGLTQNCLDRYPLMIREGGAQGDPTRFYPPKEPKLNELHVRLPRGIICDRCVLQWTYTAGNNIGRDIQETFVNCADISIGGEKDRIPVVGRRPVDGDVVVIEQRPNITAIIDRAPRGSVNDMLTALTGRFEANPNGFTGSRNLLPANKEVTSGEGRGFENDGFPPSFGHGFQPEFDPRFSNNRDPRMFIPPVNAFNPNPSPRLPSSIDTPGQSRDSNNMAHFPRFPGMNNNGDIMMGGWVSRNNLVRPSVHAGGPPEWTDSFFERELQAGQSMLNNIPPPSQVWNGDQNSVDNSKGVINDKGAHNSLLGSVGSVIGQISKNKPFDSGNHVTNQLSDTIPSREFVKQMTDLRRAFPNGHEWRRGDGRRSQSHAVRQAPMLDTHEFTTGEIRHLVPSLPSDIGPRQDVTTYRDPRFNSNVMHLRNNWFPGSQYLLQRQRMRMVNNQLPRPRTRLPRRVEVYSMAVAQHLLRKYPQLRGRVFLSRQGHLRNKFGHMTHKYARRQSISRL